MALDPMRRSNENFFFNDTAPTEIYTLSLHDALPISLADPLELEAPVAAGQMLGEIALEALLDDQGRKVEGDRKSTRLNSSHPSISYAVFCLKKKNRQSHMQRKHHQSGLVLG